jgi:Fur family ferric uptake transcriptional regulator
MQVIRTRKALRSRYDARAMATTDLERALATFDAYLRAERLKMTGQRRRMVRAAIAQQGHFTAEELHQRLVNNGETVSMATVYRGLRLLEEAGIVEGHDFADGQRRFERALQVKHHDHMICLDCRQVIEFQSEEIEQIQQRIADEHDFEIKEHNLTLYVGCKRWRETGECSRRKPDGGQAAAQDAEG